MRSVHKCAGLCLVVTLCFAGMAPAQDDDDDGIYNYLDVNPGVIDEPMIFTGSDYSLKVHGSGRLAVLNLPTAQYNDIAAGNTDSAVMQSLCKMVYNHFDDVFDFVIFSSNQDTNPGTYYGRHWGVRNDAEGLGKSIFDSSSSYGSLGQLQSTIHLITPDYLPGGPSLHEICHRWANSLSSIPTQASSHWGWSSVGGQLGGWQNGTLRDLGGGIYTADGPDGDPGFGTVANGGNSVPYGDFELYLMGLIPTNGLPGITIAMGASWTNSTNFAATSIVTVTMQEVVATDGARIPDYNNSQTNFRCIHVILADSNSPPNNARLAVFDEDVYLFSFAGDNGLATRYNFWEATGGRATMKFDELMQVLGPIDDPNFHTTPVGPTNPVTGQANAYTFVVVSNATSYRLQILQTTTNSWLEGAETNPTPQIVDNTDASYSLITNYTAATGDRSFHLTCVEWSSESFTVDRALVIGAGANLSFKTQFRFVTTNSYLAAEVAPDGSASWTEVWRRHGPGGDGGTSWSNVTVSLSAYTGQTMQVRFVFEPSTSCYLGTDGWRGLYVDDVTVTGVEQVSATTTNTLAGAATGFNFTPPEVASYRLSLKVFVDYLEYTYGPELLVNSVPAPTSISVTSIQLTGGQVEVEFSVLNGSLPTLGLQSCDNLSSTNWTDVIGETVQDLGGGAYRATVAIPATNVLFYRVQGTP